MCSPTLIWVVVGMLQVHLPLYDPDTLLQLAVFNDPGKGRLFNHGGPQLVGKLRIRLSTVAAGQQHQCRLPLMAERKQGGGRKATMHMGLKVDENHNSSMQHDNCIGNAPSQHAAAASS